MGRQTDDGHEGYIAFVFADGTYGASYAAGPIATHTADGVMLEYSQWQHRQAEEIIGWRPMCDNLDSRSAGGCWHGQLWKRVSDPDEHDPAGRRIYCQHDDLSFVDDGRLHDLLMREWEDHVAPTRGTADVRYAADEADAAQSRLAAAVRSAREQGASWEAIGKAARMTRQSAHERWSRVIG